MSEEQILDDQGNSVEQGFYWVYRKGDPSNKFCFIHRRRDGNLEMCFYPDDFNQRGYRSLDPKLCYRKDINPEIHIRDLRANANFFKKMTRKVKRD